MAVRSLLLDGPALARRSSMKPSEQIAQYWQGWCLRRRPGAPDVLALASCQQDTLPRDRDLATSRKAGCKEGGGLPLGGVWVQTADRSGADANGADAAAALEE